MLRPGCKCSCTNASSSILAIVGTIRPFVIFSATTLVTFALILAANVLALPLAFDTQGVGWSAAPFRSALVFVGYLLQIPLEAAYVLAGNRSNYGMVAIVVLSVFYGAGAVGIWVFWGRYRKAQK